MLSAVRAMAHRVAHDLAHLDTPRLGPRSTPAEQDELIAEVLERALDAANEAVERGPDQLPVLKEAGVVDAGAYGLTVIVAGVVAALRGAGRARSGPPGGAGVARRAPARARVVHVSLLHQLRRYGRRPRGRHVHPAAGGDRRQRARGWRRAHAARAPAHRRPRERRGPLRGRGRGVAARRGGHAPAGGRAHGAAGQDRERPLQRRGRGERSGHRPPLPGAGSVGSGRRAHDEPIHL